MTDSHNSTMSKTHLPSSDVFYALTIAGVATVFMLFLLGSTNIMSTLTIIGLLLCLSAVGGAMRYFSSRRTTHNLIDRAEQADLHLRTLQHRVNDHDLALLELTGKIETIEVNVGRLHTRQNVMDRQQHDFTTALKDRMLQLITLISNRKITKTKSPASKSFKMSGPTANDGAQKQAPSGALHEDDVFVSPSLVRDAIKMARATERMEVYLQPINKLPHRKIFGHEVYGRLKLQPGVYIPARDYRGIAAHDNALMTLDHLVLRELSKMRLPKGPIFINMSRDALANHSTALHMTQLLKAQPGLADKLVIELAQRDVARISKNDESVMRELQRLGISFAMNDVQTTDLDLNRLAALNFKYLKLPHSRLITGPTMDHGAGIVQRFITRLQARNITLIAGHIETEKDIRPLLDYPIELAQGYVFGRPDRAAVFATARQVA